MDQIGTILSGKNTPKEPAEIRLIKEFIREHCSADCKVQMRKTSIIIIVASGAIAHELRLKIDKLSETLDSDKRLSVRIGQL